MLSGFSAFPPKSKDLLATSTTSNVGVDQKHVPRSTSQLSSASSLNPQVDPERLPLASSSVVSQSADTGPQQQAWKKRIILLAQAQDIMSKMSEINRRLTLRAKMQFNLENLASCFSFSGENLETPAPSDGPNLETIQNKHKVLEESLIPIVSQLMEEGIWTLPTETQSDLSVERHQLYLSTSSADFDRRLDLIETQATKIREIGRLHESQHVEEEAASRASKRRRVAEKRFVQTSFNPRDVLAQLDRLQSEATSLEAETLHEGPFLELVDERVEDWLLERPIVPPVLADSPRDAVRKLDADLDILCGELADIDTNKLASQVGTLKLETGDMMQAVDLLASEMRSVQLREADLGQRTQKILEELIELGRVPQGRTDFPDGYDDNEFTVDVQQHIDTAMAQIHSTIGSHHEEIKNTVLASLEPTILKAEAIYRSFSSQPEAVEPS
ncbi:hypothetical protein JB92DRAFT_3124778 [Gautieria morchelliformis]|nr:hypothetical protein JB92DRAFT_3124778 [Gautieria morchelliformis]